MALGIAVVGACMFQLTAMSASACQTCGDTGYVAPKCEKCRGSGRCLACGGTGRRVAGMSGGGDSMCMICKGSGVCKYCNGTALDQTKKVVCPDCGGKSKPPEATADKGTEKKPGPVASSTKMVPCTVCKGTGHLPGGCAKCGGEGKCRLCEGTGRRPSGVRVGQEVMCVACKGTGKCRDCNGTGTNPTARECAICDGSGRVSVESADVKVADAESHQPPSDDTEAPSPSPHRAPGDLAGIDEYVKTMAVLDDLYAGGRAKEADFNDVWKGRVTSVGKIYRSTVYLLQSHVRGVRVARDRADLSTGGRLLMPRSPAVARKADRVLKRVGECGQVTITYGIVNGDNVTLFDIDPSLVEPDSDPAADKPAKPPA